MLDSGVGPWPKLPLGDLISDLRYGTSATCDASPELGVPVLRIPNVVGGKLDLLDLKYTVPTDADRKRYSVETNDILLVRTNGNPTYVGRSALAGADCGRPMYASYLIRIRCKEETILPDFLQAALQSGSVRASLVKAATTSAGNYNINAGSLRRLEIPVPPLDEQRRIAEVLRSVDEAIKLAEQTARSARASFNRLINDLHSRYEDNSAPLADFCVLKGLQTGPFGSQLKVSDYVDEGIPVIMPSDLRPDGIDFSGAKSTSSQKADQLPQHHLKPGDILFSRRGDVEKCGLYLEGDPSAICGTGCLRARIDVSKADPVLIYFLAQSERCGSWLTQHAVGVTMPNLNTSIVGGLPIPNLPLPEQRQWVEALLLAEGACRVNENYVVEAQSLKLVLSSDLLSGRVRVPA